MQKARILVVEDTEVFAAHLQKSLEELGYIFIACASCGEEAIKKTSQLHPDLILMDIFLDGGMDGIETAKKIRNGFDVPVIYLTALSDRQTLERAKMAEPFGYIVKPFDLSALQINIEMALYKHQMEGKVRKSEELYRSFVQHFRGIAYQCGINFKPLFIHGAVEAITGYTEEELVLENPRWEQIIHPDDLPVYDREKLRLTANYSNEYEYRIVRKDGRIRWVKEIIQNICTGFNQPIAVQGMISDVTRRKGAEEKLQSTLAILRKSLGGVIEAMALTVESRDQYTAGHQRRVADLARAIADEMGLSKEKIDGLRMAGAIHDLGKIAIPAEILSKPGRISDIEFSLIKTHAQVGYDILKTIEFPWPVAQIVHQHHERLDGSGYPLGLSGEDILIEARILAVADVVEAMSSHRPYRTALGIEKALEEICRHRGVLYDAKAVDVCMKLFKEKGFRFRDK